MSKSSSRQDRENKDPGQPCPVHGEEISGPRLCAANLPLEDIHGPAKLLRRFA